MPNFLGSTTLYRKEWELDGDENSSQEKGGSQVKVTTGRSQKNQAKGYWRCSKIHPRHY